MLKVVKYPHPALRYASVPVTRIDDELRANVRAMFDLMYANKGVGLAANQVALPLRFFVLNLAADPERVDQEQVFINPVIVKRHASIEDEEGCLSFPGLYGNVRRARRIRVKAFDLDGNDVELDADELLSRAIQHETDHVSGKLFIDHFAPQTLAKADPKIREFISEYKQAQAAGEIAADDDLVRRLEEIARSLVAQPNHETNGS